MRRWGVKPGDVYITYMPLFHTAGSVMSVLGSVSLHCTQVLVDAFEPGLVLELCETYGVNGMVAVPTMLIGMLEHADFARRDLSRVSAVCSGGSVVPDHLVRTFESKLGAPFTIIYGQTECSPCITMNDVDDVIEDKAGTIGTAMPGTEVKIVDPESNATLPIGTIGELCTRGYHVMHEYFEMPDQTSQTIDAEGWLHTGDLAAMDERGYCTIEGRLKDMIIRGGENIYPRELEDLLFAHDSVGEVAVVGLPDDRWGETVGAFIRPAADRTPSSAELFDYLRTHLAPHKTPKQWYVMEEFPMTGSGKIQKFKLREMWQRGDVTDMR
ncbi:MAG: AMP-binding protein [Pseudomonadota bacterium]